MNDDRILNDISHRRFNPLSGAWVLVSPHRIKRPWQGAQETPPKTDLSEYDPTCYLCPGNTRATGATMPHYADTCIFVNDYSAVKEDQPSYTPASTSDDSAEDPSTFLFQAQPVKGRCYVIAFSPAHNLTLADLSPAALRTIIHTWTALYASHLPAVHPHFSLAPTDLGVAPPKEQYTYLQIFENKGVAMGCSNPHPHGQAWCTTGLPSELATELRHFAEYKHAHAGRGLLATYAALELQKAERVVFTNAFWVALVPWWAVWPFEMLVIPKREVPSLPALTVAELEGLAEVISQVTKRYDNLFETQFPYSMGIHQAPLTGEGEEDMHLHLHFYPPLLRSATVRKFLVGYELMAEPQRDITPEQAAERLRNLSGEVVYRDPL